MYDVQVLLFYKFLFYKIVSAKIGNILDWQILLLWVANWMFVNLNLYLQCTIDGIA